MPAEVIRCNCEHEYQDKIYGKKMRLHNIREKKGGAVCTVCGDIKTYVTKK